jgi:hypothetical protein
MISIHRIQIGIVYFPVLTTVIIPFVVGHVQGLIRKQFNRNNYGMMLDLICGFTTT